MISRRKPLSAFFAPEPASGRTKNFPPGFTPSPPIWRAIIFAGARGIRTSRSKPKHGTRNSPSAARFRRDGPAPNEQALAAERAAAVRAAVGKLPEDLREAIVLCEWEERSVAEAAAILETTPKAVESRLYRARGILRERLKSWL